MNKDKFFVYDDEYKMWMHRTPLKCILNPILRKLQFWTDTPYVIYSECENNKNKKKRPHFLKYGVCKVKFISDYNGPHKWEWVKMMFR